MPDGEVEVKVGPDGQLWHRHPGYEGWHPVKQKHKNPNLHQELGITGKEKPNRRSNERAIGMQSPEGKPKHKPKPIATRSRTSKPDWKWDGSVTLGDFLKSYADLQPRTMVGKIIVTAVNATSWMIANFRNRMDARDAKQALQGYEDAMRAFDERFTFHGNDDFDRLTADDIRVIDKDLSAMIRQKYEEYGGESLKGKRDPESIRKKSEIRTLIELRNNLRAKARTEAEMQRRRARPASSRSTPTGNQGNAPRAPSARDLRARRNNQK